MRSFIKIFLAIKTIFAILVVLAALSLLFEIAIMPIKVTSLVEDLNIEQTEHLTALAFFSIIAGIVLIIEGFAIFACLHTIKKLNSADKKYKLIGSMFLLFFTLSYIPLLLMIFTPSKKIVFLNPYFE